MFRSEYSLGHYSLGGVIVVSNGTSQYKKTRIYTDGLSFSCEDKRNDKSGSASITYDAEGMYLSGVNKIEGEALKITGAVTINGTINGSDFNVLLTDIYGDEKNDEPGIKADVEGLKALSGLYKSLDDRVKALEGKNSES
jgi:hypothetical protein